MKREVVRDFLNLTGIAGIALMDGRSRPYFCGIDQFLNFQQKEALSQGIRQVVETTPENFESFEFQFASHQVYIYKLKQGVVLLVLAHANLVQPEYLIAIEQLKQGLAEDLAKAITTFRMLASEVAGPNQSAWKQSLDTSSNGSRRLPLDTLDDVAPLKGEASPPPHATPPTQPNIVSVAAPTPLPPAELKELLTAVNSLSNLTTQYLENAVIANYWKSSRPDHANLVQLAYLVAVEQFKQRLAEDLTKAITTFRVLASEVSAAQPSAPSPQASVAPVVPTAPLTPSAPTPVELNELLAAINSLSKMTTQYLGNAVIVNYWKSSRPDHEWLKNFQIDRLAQITFSSSSQPTNQPVSLEQHQCLREWVSGFIQRCAKVIRDFPVLVNQSALSDRQRSLLLD